MELRRYPEAVVGLPVNEVIPLDPLLAPVGDPGNGKQVPELNRVSTFGNTGQEQNLLLHVGCQAP
jgi:hypothetical protein